MKSFRDTFDQMLMMVFLLGVVLHFWGSTLNAVVLVANNGSMPVWEIGPLEEIPNGEVRWHDATKRESKLALLNDRIHIDLHDVRIQWKPFRITVETWAKFFNCPLKQGRYMASVGDLMFWAGSVLFLLMLPPILVRIPFRLARDGIRFRR